MDSDVTAVLPVFLNVTISAAAFEPILTTGKVRLAGVATIPAAEEDFAPASASAIKLTEIQNDVLGIGTNLRNSLLNGRFDINSPAPAAQMSPEGTKLQRLALTESCACGNYGDSLLIPLSHSEWSVPLE
jgi:hypothetical protein